MGKVISVVLQKGGVGKTTTSSVLLKALHKSGYRVLGIDIDPQTQFTRYVFNHTEDSSNEFQEQNIYNAFLEGDLIEHIINVDENLDFIPSSSLVYSKNEMFEERDDDILNYFKEMLDEVKDDYDFIVIDTSPALSDLETSAIIASDYLVIPMLPDANSTMEVEKFIETKFNVIKENFNPDLEILGIFANRCDNRITKMRNYRLEFQQKYPKEMLKGYVKYKVHVYNIIENGRVSDEEEDKNYLNEFRAVLKELFNRLGATLKV